VTRGGLRPRYNGRSAAGASWRATATTGRPAAGAGRAAAAAGAGRAAAATGIERVQEAIGRGYRLRRHARRARLWTSSGGAMDGRDRRFVGARETAWVGRATVPEARSGAGPARLCCRLSLLCSSAPPSLLSCARALSFAAILLHPAPVRSTPLRYMGSGNVQGARSRSTRFRLCKQDAAVSYFHVHLMHRCLHAPRAPVPTHSGYRQSARVRAISHV